MTPDSPSALIPDPDGARGLAGRDLPGDGGDEFRLGVRVDKFRLAVAQDLLRVFERDSARQRVELEMQVPGTLPSVEVDAAGMEQVLTNLLTNAIQAAGPGGRIVKADVEAAAKGDGAPTKEREPAEDGGAPAETPAGVEGANA